MLRSYVNYRVGTINIKELNSISLELLLALSNWEDFRNGTSLNYIQIKIYIKYLGANITPGYRDAKTLKAEEKIHN
jgi:hypothetical protein